MYTLTETFNVCAAKSSTEGNLLPPLSFSLIDIYHRWLGFLLYGSWSTHKTHFGAGTDCAMQLAQ